MMKRLCIIGLIIGLVAVFTGKADADVLKNCGNYHGAINIQHRNASCGFARMLVYDVSYSSVGLRPVRLKGMTCRMALVNENVHVRCTPNAGRPMLVRWQIPVEGEF